MQMPTTRTGLWGTFYRFDGFKVAVIRSIAIGFVAGFLLVGTPTLKAQDSCATVKKVLEDAMSQIHSTPTHVYTTSKIDNQNFDSEMIYASGNIYMKVSGKWSVFGTVKEMEGIEKEAEKKANSKDTCSHVKDESMNGEMAAVYSTHSETAKGAKVDSQFWISKSSGKLLRQDITTDGGKSVMASRYDYGNVKPPV